MFTDDENKLIGQAKINDTSSSNIIVFPDFEELKKRNDFLRAELSRLLSERDELQFVICKNIETKYLLELGALEHKAYEAGCTFLRLKRKLEMIQARINRQERIDISSIEAALDGEFAEYVKLILEQIAKMNEAIERSRSKKMTSEESKEFKKLYRKIVKCLHPDLNPNVTDVQKQLFANAVEAYKSGNLEMLRIIGEMVDEPTAPEKTADAMLALRSGVEKLEKMLADIRKDIEKIKSSYPYTLKEIVEDREKLENLRAELEEITKQYNEGISLYLAKIEELLRN